MRFIDSSEVREGREYCEPKDVEKNFFPRPSYSGSK
jgi:hypothetical protein